MANSVTREPELKVAWTDGRRRLAKDSHFGPWVKKVGPIRLPVHPDEPFYYLVRAICYQQLATRAAGTIHGRFVAALGGDGRQPHSGATRDPPGPRQDVAGRLRTAARGGRTQGGGERA